MKILKYLVSFMVMLTGVVPVQASQGVTSASTTPAESLVIDNGNGTYTYQNKWLVSYETLVFNTLDGDIGLDEYALDGSGTGYYIRTKPESEAQFEWANLAFQYKGLKSVKVIAGHAYYDEFLTAQGADLLWDETSQYYMVDPGQLPYGSVLRVRSDVTKYNTLKTVKDATQPAKTEVTTKIPKTEPIAPLPTHHSIALDAESNSGAKTAVSSYSWSHTCGATANLLAFGDAHRSISTDRTVTGVTYNAVAMTYVRSDSIVQDVSYYIRSSLFYLLAPTTGSAKSVVVTYSGMDTGGVGGVVSYSGAAQSGQPDANNGAKGKATAPSVVVTTTVDNCWVFDIVGGFVSSSTCGNTQRWNVVFANGIIGGSDTGAPVTPKGNQTMSWTTDNGSWAISAASFAPALPVFIPIFIPKISFWW